MASQASQAVGCVERIVMLCKTCGAEVEGKDLGDHPGWWDYYCECSNSWGSHEEAMDRLCDMADSLRKAEKEGMR